MHRGYAFLLLICSLLTFSSCSNTTDVSDEVSDYCGQGPEEWPPIVLSAENVNFKFVCSGEYDSSRFKSIYELQERSNYTGVDVIESLSDYEWLKEKDYLKINENLDLEKYSYIISYGRAVADIQFDKTGIFYGTDDYIPIVTFEEEHQGDIAFLYRLQKMNLLSILIECYTMKGDERVTGFGDNYFDKASSIFTDSSNTKQSTE